MLYNALLKGNAMKKKTIIISSTFIIFITGLVLFTILLPWALRAGRNAADAGIVSLAVILMLLIIRDTRDHIRTLRYRSVESEIEEPAVTKLLSDVSVDDTFVFGCTILTGKRLYIFSRYRKPYFREVIDLSSIRGTDLPNDITLTIMSALHTYTVISCEAGPFYEVLNDLIRKSSQKD